MDLMQLNDRGLNTLKTIVARPDVTSVACPFQDPEVWTLLIDEQTRRAATTGLPPQVAFSLCGPEHGLDDVTSAGGDIHTPLEGIAGGDLFFQPSWRSFDAVAANEHNSLRAGNFSMHCHFLVTHSDYGPLGRSKPQVFGNFFLYEPVAPFRPSDPLGIRAFYAARALGFQLDELVKADDLPKWYDGDRLPEIFPQGY